MNPQNVAAFFDRVAPNWDAGQVIEEEKLRFLLDAAGIEPGCTVLDVACGTGVLFPYYLERGVQRVVGVDVSREMVRIAAAKCRDPRVQVLCGDVAESPVLHRCDRCMVYNAFPHFADPAALIGRLAQWLEPAGRLTVAHSMSLEALHRHHQGSAAQVSREMLTPEELAATMAPWFSVDIAKADHEKYIVSGLRRP